jgi:signal transduction histidine kinase
MTRKDVRILMIDDDEEDFIIIRDLFDEIIQDSHVVSRYNYRLDWAQTFNQGLETLLERRHDVYLVDYRLGARTGLELIQEAIAANCEAPLILLTGQNNFEVDEQAMQAGAADYLIKGNTSARQLESSIRYSIRHAQHLQEIKRLNASLEERVLERTQVLEEAIRELNRTKNDLDLALRKEKDLSDLKSRFVAMASHEFRTPLATMLSSLSLVTKYGEAGNKEQQMKHILRIKSSIANLTDIINDVLSVTRLEEGGVMVACETLDIQELAEEIVREMKGITKAGQDVHFNATGERYVRTDRRIIKHLLTNLLSNAIKFSGEGKRIWLDMAVVDGAITLEVRDEGIGISEEDQKHLFERFFRAKNATNIEGTGLGLTIIAKFLELLDGSITFESELHRGTTFTIHLPKRT